MKSISTRLAGKLPIMGDRDVDRESNIDPRDLDVRRFEADLETRRAELAEKRAQRKSEERRHAVDAELKRQEISASTGRAFRFTTAQATVAAAVLALVSGAVGGLVQAWTTRDVEESKSTALIKIEEVKAKANIDLERQRFETGLITKATESPKREEQIRNLKFYLAAGFLSDPEHKIAAMNEDQYPSSPPPSIAAPPMLPRIAVLASDSAIRTIARPIGLLSFNSAHENTGPSGICTGWLVDASHVITASYCVSGSGIEANKFAFRLGFLSAEEPGNLYSVTSIAELDGKVGYAILNIDAAAGKKYGWLPLRTRSPERDEEIMIVQYAGGSVEQVSEQDCTVIDSSSTFILSVEMKGFTHRCRQEPGSGGAPVLAKRDNAILGIVTAGDKEKQFAVSMELVIDKSVILHNLVKSR
jgi:hypothetical protein